MHSLPDFILGPVSHIDLVNCQNGIFRSFVVCVVSKQGYIVQLLLFTFWRLSEAVQKLLILIVVHVLDVVDVEALLSGALAVP